MLRLIAVSVVLSLVAGCTVPIEQRPAGTEEAVDEGGPDYPGLRASGTLTRDADGWIVRAKGFNDGPRTYAVSSICVSPWGESMRRGDTAVQHREPMAVCMAFGLRDFSPGDELTYNTTWDGRLWDDEETRYRDAPAGDYTWRIILTVYAANGGDYNGESTELHLDFDVEL